MATLIGQKRVGTMRVRSTKGRLVYEFDYEYLVRASSVYEPEASIFNTAALPQVNYSQIGPAICRSVSFTRDTANATIYHCMASFSSEVEENTAPVDPAQPDNPTLWVPVRETMFEKAQEIMWRDADGDAIVNSVGKPFDTTPMRTRYIIVWEFWQFESLSVTDEVLSGRNELVNASMYKGKEPKTLLLNVLKSTVGFYYGYRCRLTQYQLKWDPRTWILKILDVGTHYHDVNGNLVPFEKKGVPYLGGLDGSGGAVTEGDPPAILEYDQYATSDFSFLRI